MKRSAVSLLVFLTQLCGVNAFANNEKLVSLSFPQFESMLTVPELPGGFYIGGTAYYLQSASTQGDLDYATLFELPLAVNVPNKTVEKLNPRDSWDWGLIAGYIFPNTGNDLQVEYMNIDMKDLSSASVSNGSVVNFVPVSLLSNFFAGPTVFANASYDLNQFDISAGQYINMGNRFHIHPTAGVRYLDLTRKINSVFINITESPVFLVLVQHVGEKSEFNGLGPLMGIDGQYEIFCHFGLVGHGHAGILVGDIKNQQNLLLLQTIDGEVIPPLAINYHDDNSHRFVSTLDAKLGANYNYVFPNSNAKLSLEAGWSVNEYFNTIDRLNTAFILIGTPRYNIINKKTSNVAFQGPYITLSLSI